ncbi:unnamed protein product [Brassicogethes aeneus]|uniref:Adenine phosphoribosyltransferase n=1 Tax=Brassicogethes aeneus TaxID=1431903 RepID=A0A9P0B1I8_BRAAE|nr:unnamed protein product [Brassicogethes aeneus]
MTSLNEKIDIIKKHIKVYPDFPKRGVLFRDIFSVLLEPEIFQILKDVIVEIAKDIKRKNDYNCVVGLDARGFILGPLLALELNLPFVPIRKVGKLPGDTYQIKYQLEYGEAICEIQKDSIKPGSKVLIVDDLLATGGTLEAARQLVLLSGSSVVACFIIMELADLAGRNKVQAPVESILQF